MFVSELKRLFHVLSKIDPNGPRGTRAEGDWESSSIKGLLDIWMLCGCCWSMMEHPSSCGRVLRFRQKITV
jgi:hypothetical protein